MKLPIPLLLYVVSLGLFGLAGWTVYQMLPIWKAEVRDKVTRLGMSEATDLLTKGRAQGPVTSNWSYTRDSAPWWAGFKEANLVGKLPPPPPDPEKAKVEEAPKPVDLRPIESLIELVSLVYDGESKGTGGNSHVIVRFKPEANVQLPEWVMKENTAASASPVARGDTVKNPPPPRKDAPPQGEKKLPVPARPTMPTSAGMSREPLQKLWAQDGGDPRRSAVLWAMRGNDGREIGKIRLVRVADDAQSAFFVRELPPAKAGEPAAEGKEEELIKTNADLSQDILQILRELNGARTPTERRVPAAAEIGNPWRDVETTERSGNNVFISRKDEQRFRDSSEDFVGSVTMDTYASRSGKLSGLIVKAVDQRLASYGVAAGEVLTEVNGRKISSKAELVSFVKGEYNRGVRTFTTKWLSNGQVIERVYQAPPDKK